MYYICKLDFNSSVHFGNKKLDYTKDKIDSDTLFSAIINESVSLYGEDIVEKFLNMVNENKFRISDTFPYTATDILLPKPIIHNSAFTDATSEDNEVMTKKDYKKLNYIPMKMYKRYLEKIKGGKDFTYEEGEKLKNLDYGKKTYITKNNIKKDDDTGLYDIEGFTFKEECGLYFIADIEPDFYNQFIKIMEGLAITGIGGKRSTGFGSFYFYDEPIEGYNGLEKMLNSEGKYNMLLSFTVPNENQEVKGYYVLDKKSGFKYSVMASEATKKRDIFGIKSGSVLENKIEGALLDIKTNRDNHSIYKYGMPMYLNID